MATGFMFGVGAKTQSTRTALLGAFRKELHILISVFYIFRFGTPLPQALPPQRRFSSLGAQDETAPPLSFWERGRG